MLVRLSSRTLAFLAHIGADKWIPSFLSLDLRLISKTFIVIDISIFSFAPYTSTDFDVRC